MGPLIPLFWTSVIDSICNEFQSQGGSLTCVLSHLYAIPHICLWCNTYQPLDSQHGGQLHSLNAFFRCDARFEWETCSTSRHAILLVIMANKLVQSLDLLAIIANSANQSSSWTLFTVLFIESATMQRMAYCIILKRTCFYYRLLLVVISGISGFYYLSIKLNYLCLFHRHMPFR